MIESILSKLFLTYNVKVEFQPILWPLEVETLILNDINRSYSSRDINIYQLKIIQVDSKNILKIERNSRVLGF